MKETLKQPCPEIDAKFRRQIVRRLLSWFEENRRDLPWRRRRTPYRVTVSEFMLQQTQVSTVVPYYKRWMKRFPSWRALAKAPEEDVLKWWEGLGYYRRARNLQSLARTVCQQYGGHLPRDAQQLLALPGIGPYTAAAIASLCWNEPSAVVDGNVERVYSRLFDLSWDFAEPGTRKRIQSIAESLLPRHHPGSYNEALMELGAVVCVPGRPHCHLCPLRSACQAKNPSRLPIKSRPATVKQKEEILILTRNGRIWLLAPNKEGRWKGLHRLPTSDQIDADLKEKQGTLTYAITKYRVTADIWTATARDSLQHGIWLTPSELKKATLPSPHRRALAMAPATAARKS